MLKVFTNGETLIFTSAWEAADSLQHLGINAALSEEERLEKDLHRVGWNVSGMKSSRARVDRNLLRVMEGFLGGLGETVSNGVE